MADETGNTISYQPSMSADCAHQAPLAKFGHVSCQTIEELKYSNNE